MENLTDTVTDLGDSTLINGQGPLQSAWGQAAASRVTLYLNEGYLGKPIYEVMFAGQTVLSAPYNLAVNSELTWVLTGWKFVVKYINIDSVNDTIIAVTCLVEQIPR
jgi:hypothetical protein